jgi:hypothetical protein
MRLDQMIPKHLKPVASPVIEYRGIQSRDSIGLKSSALTRRVGTECRVRLPPRQLDRGDAPPKAAITPWPVHRQSSHPTFR